MPALTEIFVDNQPTRRVEIQCAVTVIGSSPNADAYVPGIDEHLATVEFRGGKYMVHNRSRRRFRLNGRSLGPGKSREWASGRMLECDERRRLVLWTAEDPRPRPMMRHRAAEETQAPMFVVRKTPWYGRRRVLVGLLCLGTVLCMSALTTGRAQPVGEFEAVLRLWLAQDCSEGSRPESDPSVIIATKLQHARRLELGGNDREAYLAYVQIKDFLQSLENRAHAASATRLTTTRRYVADRLAAL